MVSVDTDLKISGKIAQFGSGMIKEVSTKLLGQFVNCLEGKLAADVPVPSVPATATSAVEGRRLRRRRLARRLTRRRIGRRLRP